MGLVFLIFVAGGLTGLNGCSGKDSWMRLQEELTGRGILTVELRSPGPKNEVVTGQEAEVFAAALLEAAFDEANSNNFGPTPEVALLYQFDRYPLVAVGQWPDGRFEVSSEKEQFLLTSQELVQLLRNKGFVYP